MIKILFISLTWLLSLSIIAQTTEGEKKLREQAADSVKGWRLGAVTNINLSQTSLINWSAGGQNAIAINGVLSIFANYKKEKSAWDNSLDLGYGKMRQGDKNSPFIKTDDKIDLLSKYGQQAFKNWYYAALLNFKTQMDKGYNYPNDSVIISEWLAPAYLLVAVGMDYKPNNFLSMFVAPVTGKITMVNNQVLADSGAFGVEPGKKSLSEFGGYLRVIYSKSDFKQEILKNVSFTSKIDLFSNYLNHPEKVDVSWENLVVLKVNKYVSVSFNTHLLYDYDIKIEKEGEVKDRIQFKEILGVGFSYKF